MSVRILTEDRSKLIFLSVIILLCSGYYNYFYISEPFFFFFRISSLTGQVLVNKFLSICNCTYEIVKLTYSFFQILYEDSLTFLKDATEKFTFAIYLLKDLYLFLEELGWNFLEVLSKIEENIINFCGFIKGTVETVRGGLYLTGSTIWYIFTNLPQTLVSDFYGIIEFVRNTFNDIIISTLRVKEKVIHSIQNSYLFIFDVPLDSVYGLIIGAILITIICIKFKDICCLISSAFLKLYQQAILFGISIWNGRFLERKAANNDYNNEDDERLCIICQYQLKEIIIFPCKHLCLCVECSNELEKNQPVCPICRGNIAGTLKVYL